MDRRSRRNRRVVVRAAAIPARGADRARTRASGADHGAAGGAVTLRLELFEVPLLVTYQIARRLFDGRALTQLVGVALD
ncbi:MAG TPA: hypothetical protein VGF94_14170 [Kofleriaceae bacterium]